MVGVAAVFAVLVFPVHVSFSAFVVDNFRGEVGNQIEIFSPTVNFASVNVTGINPSDTVGGSRYYEITAAPGSEGAVVARTETIAGVVNRFTYTSDATAIAGGLLSYGRFEDLNANFDRNGLITGFRLSGLAADEPAQTGFMSLTVYSPTGTGTVTKDIIDLLESAEWLHEEFAGDNIDFSNVSRLDLEWGGFTTGGADFNINFSISTVNGLPEPGTMSLMGLAMLMLFLVRGRGVLRASEPALAHSRQYKAGTVRAIPATDLYNVPHRSV